MLYPFLKSIAPFLGHFSPSFWTSFIPEIFAKKKNIKSSAKVGFRILVPCLGPSVINV